MFHPKHLLHIYVLAIALLGSPAHARDSSVTQTSTEDRGKESAVIIITETNVLTCDATVQQSDASALDRKEKCAPKKITCLGGQGDAGKVCYCPKGTSEKECLKRTKCPEGTIAVPAECSAIRPKPPAGSVCTACVMDF